MKNIANFFKNKNIIYLVIILVLITIYYFINYKEGITGNTNTQTNIPICNLFTEQDCTSNPGYCDWNSNLHQCSNKNNCYNINNKSSCNSQKYCNWDKSNNICNIKK